LARAAAVEVIGDIELFCRERRAHAPNAPFVAITGTNGKSTTTALTAHLVASAGYDAQMGGNIGTAILSLEPARAGRVHVIECSSYQIDLAPTLDPSVGILINVTEDHLDRHGTLAHYAAVKERLVAGVQEGGTAVRYGIGVGRPGFTWSGVRPISRMREWPDWTPPPEMLKRRPDLPRHMDGGPDNPLGARAMYLGSSLYRIHGSNEPWTIGTNVSSGCIRMRNEDVVDLYRRVRVGTKVVVM